MPKACNAQGASGLTGELAEWLSHAARDPLATDVAARTAALVYDAVGALAAASHPDYSTGARIAAFAQAEGGRAEASVVGHGFRTGSAHAALANGTMGYACDFEPHHPEAILHPLAVMVPTVLAVGEPRGLDGRRFLTAVALGCETAYRTSMALGPAELYALGFHPSAVCGCFGAAAAAGAVLDLDAEAMERALGLAACQASGLMAWESDPSENARPFQMGMAARNGVSAARLAEAGFGGPTAVFDAAHSPFHAFSRNPRPAQLTAGLGERFDGVMELAIKPYPCVSFLHPALDALHALMREDGLTAPDITALTMRFARAGVHCVDGNPLKSHCAQYVLAVAAARGRLEVADLFADRREGDEEVRALSTRIRVEADDDALAARFPDAYATELVVRLGDGRELYRRNDIARGYPETPLGPDEVETKFRLLVASVARAERVEALHRTLEALPSSRSVAGLADALREIRM